MQRPLVHLRFDSPLWPYFNRHPSSAIRFVSHLYQSRREYRQTCQTAGKSGKQIERCVISTFQVAESMGFKGEYRQWEHLLRIGE